MTFDWITFRVAALVVSTAVDTKLLASEGVFLTLDAFIVIGLLAPG